MTDALVVCGIVDPDNFFGGAYKLDPALSERAIMDRIAIPLGLDLPEAAAGILEIVNARMANLIRKVSIESGHDPSGFALYAYGGATGAHCAEFARHLGIGKLILPYAGPVFSALGVAIADIAYSHTRSEPMPLTVDRIEAINANFATLRTSAAADMQAAGIDPAECTFRHRIEMRYRGQMNEVTLDWPSDRLDPGDIDVLRNLFEAYYQKRFGAGTVRAETLARTDQFPRGGDPCNPPPGSCGARRDCYRTNSPENPACLPAGYRLRGCRHNRFRDTQSRAHLSRPRCHRT